MGCKEWLADASILVVDDEVALSDILKRILEAEGFRNVYAVHRPQAAIDMVRELSPDLLLVDYHMPQMTGVALLEEISGMVPPSTFLPTIILTADPSAEIKQRALVCGASDFIHKPVEPLELVNRVRNLLRTRFLYLQLHGEKKELEVRVSERIAETQRAQLEILDRLAVASEYRDDETAEHTRRVGDLAGRVALRMGLAPEQAAVLRQAAQLHDIGKIGISDEVLLAPGKLSDEQFAEMQQHTLIGKEILSGGSSDLVLLAEDIACCHHERWDGNGYPNRLRGDEIPLAARIVALADFFDALTHNRRYRSAVPVPEVVKMIRGAAGTHFDPEVVHAFLREIND